MNASSPALRDLIDLGRTCEERVPASLNDDAAWNAFNDGPDSWVGLASALHEDELEHLIRGLVLYGRASGRYHKNRMSPVTWLFASFALWYPESEARLGAWVVANRVSPYDPFGAIDDGQTHTLREHLSRARDRFRAILDAPREAGLEEDLAIAEQAEHTHHAFFTLEATVKAGFARMDERFERIDMRFERMDARFVHVDARLDRIDARFDRMGARFDHIDERFAQMGARFDRVEANAARLEAKMDAGFARIEGKLDRFIEVQSAANEMMDRRLRALEA